MLVIVGPSASGKTQIVKILMEQYGLHKMVTYTTREKRLGEQDGIDYHFIDQPTFLKHIEKDCFLEYVEYNGNLYGTAKGDLTADKVVILEQSGLRQYIEKARSQIKIVFLRCSKPVLAIRMHNRGDAPASIQKRLVSDDIIFGKAVAELADIIIDTTASNIYDDAKRIYLWYQPVLGEK